MMGIGYVLTGNQDRLIILHRLMFIPDDRVTTIYQT
jgi:hypothetical protein